MVMTRRRAVLIISCCLAIAAAAGSVLWWNLRDDEPESQSKQTVGDHRISLNQEPEDTGGLSVSQGGASDLGQLGSLGQDSSGAGDADGAGTYDFTKYEKYRNDKSALFGDIKKGAGAALTLGKKATVLYKGWLTNGALIDQSPTSAKGEPQSYTFTMGNHEVIPGWEQGLYGMKAGGVRLVIVPPAAGYGSEGKGAVPPNAVLVFEVRLTKVQ